MYFPTTSPGKHICDNCVASHMRAEEQGRESKATIFVSVLFIGAILLIALISHLNGH